MAVTSQLEEARKLHAESVQEMEDWDAKYQALPQDGTTDPKEEEFLRGAFESAREKTRRFAGTVERLTAIEDARKAIPDPAADSDTPPDTTSQRVSVGSEPLTYRKGGQHSFFSDLYRASSAGGQHADSQKRLHRHAEEMRVELRDITTGDPGGASFIPPIYLGAEWVELPRESRPFANAVPKIDLPLNGMTISVPQVQTGTTVAVQATQNTAVSETDFDSQTLSVGVSTIAGQNDVSRQLLERSQPGIDQVIFRDLMDDYDMKLDTQLLAGTGSNNQHLGIRAVSGINAVTFTSGSPTAVLATPKIYDAIQQVATNRYANADTIVMHPRRGAWLASSLGTSFPLFQLGALMQASGSQQAGFVDNLAGLRVVLDANIGTTYGASTNEDEIYVLRSSDVMLAEGQLQSRVFEDVLSGTLTVRLQVYAYSAFISARLPKAISKVSGTGLVAPAF